MYFLLCHGVLIISLSAPWDEKGWKSPHHHRAQTQLWGFVHPPRSRISRPSEQALPLCLSPVTPQGPSQTLIKASPREQRAFPSCCPNCLPRPSVCFVQSRGCWPESLPDGSVKAAMSCSPWHTLHISLQRLAHNRYMDYLLNWVTFSF